MNELTNAQIDALLVKHGKGDDGFHAFARASIQADRAQRQAVKEDGPTNEELEDLWQTSHWGHPADFAADVLERWGGWPQGVLGHGGSLPANEPSATQLPEIPLIERQAVQEPIGWMAFEGAVPLHGYTGMTEYEVKFKVLDAARQEGYKGTVSGRLLELGWHIAPIYTAAPQPAQVPLTPEQIEDMRGEANRGFNIEREDYFKAVRDTEAAYQFKENEGTKCKKT